MSESKTHANEYSLDLTYCSDISAYVAGHNMYAVGYGWAKCIGPYSWEGEAQKAEKVHPLSTLYLTLYDGSSNNATSITSIEIRIKSGRWVNPPSPPIPPNPPLNPFEYQTKETITFGNGQIFSNPWGPNPHSNVGCNTIGWVWQTAALTTLASTDFPNDARYVFSVKIELVDSQGKAKVFKVDPTMIVGPPMNP